MGERLTQAEAAWLYGERPGATMHVGMLLILEGQIPYELFRDRLGTRLAGAGLAGRLRQRPVPVPLGLAHPTWEDDPNFDITNHLRHVTVPAPGGDEQLFTLVAEIFAPPLDRRKPLWEGYLITGLEGDRSAILMKIHHCMTKTGPRTWITNPPPGGVLGPSDQTPEAEPWQPAPPPPAAKRLLDAIGFTLAEQVRLIGSIGRGLLRPRNAIREAQTIRRTFTKTSPWMLRSAPRTPWSRKLGPRRRVTRAQLSFPEAREIRAVYGGTINDIMLAVLTGALRRYLQLHDWNVDGPEIRIVVPFNPDLMQGGGHDNRRRGLVVPVPIGEADPVARLRIVQERMNRLKEEGQAAALDSVVRFLSFAPAPVHWLLGKLPMRNRAFNMVCTNVPGARVPIGPPGHMLLEQFPVVPLNPGNGLGAGVFSYVDKLFFALTSDPDAVPDLDALKGFIEDSFAELLAAARAAAPATNGAASGTEPAATPAASRDEPG
jgi:WS/DGAT/MGAT family acyltransferase